MSSSSPANEVAAENHGKVIVSKGFLHTRKIGAIMPVVHFTMEGVALGFGCAKLSGGKGSMMTGSMDIGDGRVDGRFGRTTNWEEDRQDPKRRQL